MTSRDILPAPIRAWLHDNEIGDFQATALTGGDINDTYAVFVSGVARFCVKYNHDCPSDFFVAEAKGLNAIANCKTLRTPWVLHVADSFLVLEYIQTGHKSKNYWQHCAASLAGMHRQPQPRFGFSIDNYCGHTPQPNPQYDNGYQFFREQRILYQACIAFDRNYLSKSELATIEYFANTLEQLIPPQAPALLHGDLWYGNIMTDNDGEPVIIDPAAYWGWPEADLAMTSLFGGVPAEFYQHYTSINALEPDWRQRFDIYNVYHLLNHLNLFGGAYHSQVMKIVRRYS